MILRVIRWIFGYVVFSVENKNSRFFLNSVTKSKMKLWDIEKINDIMIFKTSSNEFKIISKMSRFNNIKLNLIKRIGLPFFLLKNKNRKGFLLGIFILFSSLKVLSLYIWKINVQGIENISLEKVIDISKECGISIGARKKDINSKISSQNIMSRISDISWMSINVEGCTANILIKEREKEPSIDENNSNEIKAECDARIVRMETFSGTPLVNQGDAVLKDQILVSGTKTIDENGNEKISKPKANIWGEICEEFTESEKMCQTKKVRTGNKKTILKFKGFNLNFWEKVDDKNSEVEKYGNEIKFLSFSIPTGFSTEKYFETKEVEVHFTKDEILHDLRNRIDNKIKEMNIEVISKQEDEIVNENNVSLKVIITFLKNISTYKR